MIATSIENGSVAHGTITKAGTDPEQNFRFVKLLPPHSKNVSVHVSSRVVRTANLKFEELTPGVVVKINIKSSFDRRGNPSWTATSISLAPDFNAPKAYHAGRSSLKPTHLGVVDSGGVQHLGLGDAWFIEYVTPEVAIDKIMIPKRGFSRNATPSLDQVVPGVAVMFHFDGRRASDAELLVPSQMESKVLAQSLAHFKAMPVHVLAAIIVEVMRRGEQAILVDYWKILGDNVCDQVVQTLHTGNELETFSADFPDELIVASIRQLTPEHSLAMFPTHPSAWGYPNTASVLCAQAISKGVQLNELVEICLSHNAVDGVWAQLADTQNEWINAQVSDPYIFSRLLPLLNSNALRSLLKAVPETSLIDKYHLFSWLPDSTLQKWLEQYFDGSFEPNQDLIDKLIPYLKNSNIAVPLKLNMWVPELWDPQDIYDLLKIIHKHHLRLRINRNDDRSLSLISECVGLLLHTYSEWFNDPDVRSSLQLPGDWDEPHYWGDTPPKWVGYIVDLVKEFPEIDVEVQTRSAFGAWEQQVGFDGPSKVWLYRDNLSEGWAHFDTNEKILAIYLYLANNWAIPMEVSAESENHPFIRALLILIDGARLGQRSEMAVVAHNLITKAVLKRIPAPGSRAALSPDDLVIDFDRALPRCGEFGHDAMFCEGNHISKPSYAEWDRHRRSPKTCPKPKSIALTSDMKGECHCHRLEKTHGGYAKSGCTIKQEDGNGVAHLFARTNLPWAQWTLLEVLSVLGYPPNLITYFSDGGGPRSKPRLQPAHIAHNEYVNKIAAVVNRINELRDRLRCGWRNGKIESSKGCGHPMVPDFSYRVFPAAYGITVFSNCTSCEDGPHDKGTYINHCKRCVSIIDSRESPIKDDSGLNTYVCVHCGGWGAEGAREFRKCSKCGSYNSELNWDNKTVHCRECSHAWRPLDKYWSGLN